MATITGLTWGERKHWNSKKKERELLSTCHRAFNSMKRCAIFSTVWIQQPQPALPATVANVVVDAPCWRYLWCFQTVTATAASSLVVCSLITISLNAHEHTSLSFDGLASHLVMRVQRIFHPASLRLDSVQLLSRSSLMLNQPAYFG